MRAIIGLIFMLVVGIGHSIFLIIELFIEHKKEKDRERELAKNEKGKKD